jgi:hypothetical protein
VEIEKYRRRFDRVGGDRKVKEEIGKYKRRLEWKGGGWKV